MFRNICRLMVVLLTVTTSLFFCNCSKESPETIKIGLLSVFTGQGANYGKAARQGVDLAVEEINSRGGIKGKRIEIIYEDSKGEPKDAISAFQKLVFVDKVSIVIGPFYSSEVLACASSANTSRVVLMTGSGTSDNIRTAGEFIFRVCPSNDAQGKSIADFVIDKLQVKNSYILFRNVDYGVTLKDGFSKRFTERGGTILGDDGIVPDATDVRTQLQKANSKSPDVIFAPVHYPEGSVLLKQAQEMGVKCPIIGGDGGYDPELIKRAGNAAEGSYWATVGWGGGTIKTLVDQFIIKFKQKYGEEPGVYSGLYYDATNVIASAIEKSASYSGDALQQTLLGIKDFQGPTGVTSFDQNGDVDKPFAVYKVQNGQFVITE